MPDAERLAMLGRMNRSWDYNLTVMDERRRQGETELCGFNPGSWEGTVRQPDIWTQQAVSERYDAEATRPPS